MDPKVSEQSSNEAFRSAMVGEVKARSLVAVIIPEISEDGKTWDGDVIYMLHGEFRAHPDPEALPGWASVLRRAADMVEDDEEGSDA